MDGTAIAVCCAVHKGRAVSRPLCGLSRWDRFSNASEWRQMIFRSTAFVLALSFAGSAQAGALTCNGAACQGSFTGAAYASTKCPAAPVPPVVQTNNAANYNSSVQKANDYSAAVKKQLDCVAEEANADQKDIGDALRDTLKHAQDEAQANLDKLKADLKNPPKSTMGSQSSAPSVSTRY
jgi:hypothetical protein